MPSAHGELTRAPSAIDPHRLTGHTSITGATGTGKSVIIQNIVIHLVAAYSSGTFLSAVILFDMKDDDSVKTLRQLGPDVLASGRAAYIDFNSVHAPGGRAPVGINPLEILGYPEGGREAAVSQAIGHIMEILKTVYEHDRKYVQYERLMLLCLEYLYSLSDAPTMTDLHRLVLQLRDDPTAAERLARAAPGRLRGPLLATRKLRADDWVSILNRVEPFVVDGYLSRRLSVRRTTVDLARALEPGSVTIFRVSEAETPPHLRAAIVQVVLFKVWQALQARVAAGGERTPVITFLDEFHVLGDTELLETMVSRGRSAGLGLVLSHQNPAQVPARLLATVHGNASTVIVGRVTGDGARIMARLLDPGNAGPLAARISALGDRMFAMSTASAPGQERAEPAWFASRPPPPLLLGEGEAAAFEAEMCRRHAPEEARATPTDAWRDHLGARYLTAAKWRIVLSLMGGRELNAAAVSRIVAGLGLTGQRDEVGAWVAELVDDGTVEVARTKKRGIVNERFYRLSEAGVREYEAPDWSAIGTAEDVAGVAAAALAHYMADGMFVCVASQGGGGEAPDLVAYDHATRTARAVEIESRAEVTSHPEHVVHNMSKARRLGFSGCDTWSLRPHVVALRGRLDPATARTVRCFVMDGGSWVCR